MDATAAISIARLTPVDGDRAFDKLLVSLPLQAR
jgi:hypothetical protein